MFRRVRFVLASCLVLLAVTGFAAPALAAPSAWSFVDVGLHVEQGQTLLLVAGDLPEDVPLPYEAQLAVPSGTQLRWIGEILGGPPAEDPQLPYTKTTVGDMDVYTFTLTKSRTAQFEGIAAGMTGVSGQNQSTAIKWTAWQDLPSVRVSQRLPRGAQIVQPSEGASLQPGDETYSYYSKTVSNAKAGDVLDLSFSYTVSATAPAGSTSGASSSIIVPVFMGAAVLLLGALVLIAARRKPEAGGALSAAEARPQEGDSATHQIEPSPVEEVAEELDVEPVGEPSGRGTFLRPQFLMLGALVLMVVVAVSVISSGGSGNSGRISKFFGSTSPCTSVSLGLTPKPNVDLAERGEDIVDAFSGYDGIGDVTLTIASSTLDVTFCQSSHTEASIRQIVEGTGLVTLAAK